MLPPLVLAASGWAALVLGLALAGLAAAAAELAGLRATPAAAVPAATVLLVAVPLVLLLHRSDRSVLALHGPAQAVTGAAVTGLAVAVVFGADALAGGTRITAVEPAVLVTFLLTTTLLALALEAVPEEIALRVSVYGSLARRGGPALAGVATTAAFVVAPGAAISLSSLLGRLTGLPTPPPSFAPGGQDPVAYAVALVASSAVLVLARATTGSVWACVGVHLVFLTANRTLLPSGSDTGLTVTSPGGAELLVLVYLAVTAVGLLLVRRSRTRRRRGPAGRHPAQA